MNYYYYIAGMPDLTPSNAKAAPGCISIIEELREQLTPRDFKLLELIAEPLTDPEKAEEYYNVRLRSHNRFVRQWAEFNLNINNILTAIICRQNNWDIRANIVGNNAVTQAICENPTAKDFGLRGELEYFDTLMQIVETDNLMDREQKIDALKWTWLEDNTFFDFFTVEKILVYYLKAEMLNRWNILTVEKGERIFREIIDNLKRDVTFE